MQKTQKGPKVVNAQTASRFREECWCAYGKWNAMALRAIDKYTYYTLAIDVNHSHHVTNFFSCESRGHVSERKYF